MNHLFKIVRVVLPVFIAWGLISSCDSVEKYLNPHEVQIFIGVRLSLEITSDVNEYVGGDPAISLVSTGDKCPVEGNIRKEDLNQDGYLDITGDSFLCVPERLPLKFRVTGIYNNNAGERVLTDSEVDNWIRWEASRLPDSEITADVNMKTWQYPDTDYDQGISFQGGVVSVDAEAQAVGDATKDATEDVLLKTFFLANQLNGDDALTPIEQITLSLQKPILEEINIDVNLEKSDTVEDGLCSLLDENKNKPEYIVEGCLRQFVAIGEYNNDLTADITEEVEWESKNTDSAELVTNYSDVAAIQAVMHDEFWKESIGDFFTGNDKLLTEGLVLAKNQNTLFLMEASKQIVVDGAAAEVIGTSDQVAIVPASAVYTILGVNPDSVRTLAGPDENDLYSMIENSNANLISYSVYENYVRSTSTQLVTWCSSDLDTIEPSSSGNILAKQESFSDVTIWVHATSDCEATSDRVEMRVNVDKEYLKDVLFYNPSADPRYRSDVSGDYYNVNRAKMTDIYAVGIYNNEIQGYYNDVYHDGVEYSSFPTDGLEAGRVSEEIIQDRKAKLNIEGFWELTTLTREGTPSDYELFTNYSSEDCPQYNSSNIYNDPANLNDPAIDILAVLKCFGSFEEYQDSSDSAKKSDPVYFRSINNGTADLQTTVSGIYPDGLDGDPTEKTYMWNVVISKDGRPPFNVRIVPNPASYPDIWIAERDIQLEAVGVYTNGDTIILGEQEVKWTWILENSTLECDASDDNSGKECQCDITDTGKTNCVSADALLSTREELYITASCAMPYCDEFDTINVIPENTLLESITIIPESKSVNGGDIVFLGVRGAFNNDKNYWVKNKCLQWEVQSGGRASILIDSEEDTFVAVKVDQTIDSVQSIDIEAKTVSSDSLEYDLNNCGEAWQTVQPDFVYTGELSVTPLPTVEFDEAVYSVKEGCSVGDDSCGGGTSPIRIFRASPSTGSKDITVFYKLHKNGVSDSDYTLTPSGQAIIPQGQSYVDISFDAILDNLNENDETIDIEILGDYLVNGRPGSLTVASVVITSEDSLPAVSLPASVEVDEDAGFIFVKFELSLDADVGNGRDIMVEYDISGDISSDDYSRLEPASPLTIVEGVKEAYLRIDIDNDDLYEGPETFQLKVVRIVSNENVEEVSDVYAVITIEDNDDLSITAFDSDSASSEYCGDYTTCSVGKKYSFTPKTNNAKGADNNNNAAVLNFSISNKPQWADFDTATGTLSASGGTIPAGAETYCEGVLICVEDTAAGGVNACWLSFNIIIAE